MIKTCPGLNGREMNRVLEGRHAKDDVLQAPVLHVFVDRDPLAPFSAVSHKFDYVCVLKLRKDLDFVLK